MVVPMALAATIVRIEVARVSVRSVGREFILTSTIVPPARAVSGLRRSRTRHRDSMPVRTRFRCAALPSRRCSRSEIEPVQGPKGFGAEGREPKVGSPEVVPPRRGRWGQSGRRTMRSIDIDGHNSDEVRASLLGGMMTWHARVFDGRDRSDKRSSEVVGCTVRCTTAKPLRERHRTNIRGS